MRQPTSHPRFYLRYLELSDDREQAQAEISADVAKVKDHLAANRTTEREAADICEAARRSLVDHSAAKGLRKIG